MFLRKLSIILILFSIWGCSTKKNTWLSRNYHNLTAYYNVYYNGKEAFKNGDKVIIEGYQNDYSNILPLFESSDPDAASVASGDMDRAIEKGQKLIKKHSITAKPKKRSRKNQYAAEFYSKKEFNAWVDDAYVLIGKAQVYKHEQSLAIRTLQRVVRDFPNDETMYEALIWQARAYTDRGDYIGAMAALESYDLGGNAPIELYPDYMAVYANLLMVQEKYIEAIPYLNNALEDEQNKHKRLRYSYVLGQLYLLNDQREEAALAFAYVAKASADYEMTFNAKVNQASIVYANADIEEVKKQLHKLRKDKKNSDYLDRIYYAFGRVALQEHNESEALSYFKKSINASIDNKNQKGLSYRETGEIYYSHMDYANAYFYYDSALTVINEDYEKIDELKERHYGLGGLVDHLLTVEREDSLQRLADMSEPVLYAYLDEIIAAKEAEQERLQKLQEEESLSDAFFYQSTSGSNNFGQSGKWYFYNQTSMGMGKLEFEKRWGKRKLEDNWRRKDKGKISTEESQDDPFDMPDNPFEQTPADKDQQTETDSNVADTNTSVAIPTREQLLADIPLSDEDRLASDKAIEDALLEQGFVFMDRLENYPKAIEALESLLSRYPKAESRDEALIALYNAYRLNGDENGMMLTQKKIEAEYPDHRFVAYLNDPEFLNKIQKAKQEEALAYEKTYEAFLFGRFDEVINNSEKAITNAEETSQLINKYLLLRGLSFGKSGNTDFFKSDLNSIIENDGESEEAALAQALLKHLEDGKAPVQGTLFASSPGIKDVAAPSDTSIVAPEQQAGFVFVENEAYELIVMGINESDINRAIYNVADYNFSRYLLHDFEISEKRLLDGSAALIVSGFGNRVEVMDYFYGLRENPQFFNFERLDKNIVALSESNNSKFYLSGLVTDYISFFDKYYLQHADRKEVEKITPKEEKEEVIEQTQEETPDPVSKTEQESQNIEPEKEKKEEAESSNTKVNVNEQKEGVTTETKSEEIMPPAEDKKISEETNELIVEEETVIPEPESIYKVSDEEAHHVIVIIRKTRLDFNKVQRNFASHTRNNLGTDYKVQLLEFATSYRMVQIDGFKNGKEAKDYINSLDKYQYLTRDYSRKEHYIWSISESNFKTLKETEDLEEYNTFFKSNQ